MFLDFSQIKGLHLELTSKCNLLCPQCARVKDGKVKSNLPLRDLTLDEIKPTFLKIGHQLEVVHICGNFGDPVASSNTLEILKFIRGNFDGQLRIYTNGSARSSDWWSDLAKILIGREDHVVFSIDGMEDTNHIYRTNSRWEKVMVSAEAFIASGGRAVWEFLVFKHNEHQVEEAKLLAAQMGFRQFRVKRPSRSSGMYRSQEISPIEPSEIYENKAVLEVGKIIEDRFDGDHIRFLNEAKVSCKYQNRQWVYLSFENELWPCCWLASAKYKVNPSKFEQGVKKLFEVHGDRFLSLSDRPIESVLKDRWFAELLEASWLRNIEEIENPKLRHCGSHCHTLVNMEIMANQTTYDL